MLSFFVPIDGRVAINNRNAVYTLDPLNSYNQVQFLDIQWCKKLINAGIFSKIQFNSLREVIIDYCHALLEIQFVSQPVLARIELLSDGELRNVSLKKLPVLKELVVNNTKIIFINLSEKELQYVDL